MALFATILAAGHAVGLKEAKDMAAGSRCRGHLAALLLSGQQANWTIKRNGVWWLSNGVRGDETQAILRAVAKP